MIKLENLSLSQLLNQFSEFLRLIVGWSQQLQLSNIVGKTAAAHTNRAARHSEHKIVKTYPIQTKYMVVNPEIGASLRSWRLYSQQNQTVIIAGYTPIGKSQCIYRLVGKSTMQRLLLPSKLLCQTSTWRVRSYDECRRHFVSLRQGQETPLYTKQQLHSTQACFV